MAGLIAALVGSGLACDTVSGRMADLAAESASHVSLSRESLRGDGVLFMRVFCGSGFPALVNFEELAPLDRVGVLRTSGGRGKTSCGRVLMVLQEVFARERGIRNASEGLEMARIIPEWPQKALKPRFFPILLNIYGFSVIISSVIFDVFGPLGGV